VLRRAWIRWTILIISVVTVGAIMDAVTHSPWYFGPLLLGMVVAGQALFIRLNRQRRSEESQTDPTDSD
jgi:hypothetical protein